jgi:trimeric autotransporter adhesin
MPKTPTTARIAAIAIACLLTAAPSRAAQPKEPARAIDYKAFFAPELAITSSHAELRQALPTLANRAAWESFLAGSRDGFVNPADVSVWIDPRSGAAVNILGAYPLIPGNGFGNAVTLQSLGATSVDARVVESALRGFVDRHQALLGIDVRQLGTARVTQVTEDLWQVYIPQAYEGIPVRYGALVASISHGNLVTIGTDTWGNVSGLFAEPAIPAEAALFTGFAYTEAAAEDVILEPARLEVIPAASELAKSAGAEAAAPGYLHRLVWVYVFQRPPDGARWEVMVDAHSGELIALQDVNHYVQRQATGGIYPVTSTEICPSPLKCGTMQPNYPMPFANTGLAAPNNFANSAGVFDWTSGTATTTLSGRYVRIADTCGAISASSATGNIALGGTNGQHDCTTPGAGGAGNTAASRSAFYEVNRIAEMARGWLPSNTWLNAQVTANVNINQTCNGFWNGSTINFYRSGGGCRNTGELAGVFDHEWGHGMDDNDANGVVSNSGEGYADIAAIYRYQDSCIGHGFFMPPAGSCGLTADGTGANTDEDQNAGVHCATDCSGVRDADYGKHADGIPDTPLNHVCGRCLTGTGPCGRQVHCAAAPQRQAAWDLVARDLPAAGYDSQSAFLVGNRLFYQGSGNIGTWYSCTCGSASAGCATTNGYMQWITADDDNGNLNDGTPHMTAIYNAFNRHGIACSTPARIDSGCAGAPSGSAGPTVSGTAGNYSAALSWNAVSGATRYWVMRTEGHAGCSYGKAKIAEVTGTSYTDTQVANGRPYSYNIVAAGASNSCYSKVGNCATVTPTASATPDFAISCSPASVSVQQGNSVGTTCTVTSTGGFAGAVSLACASLPAGVSCAYSPNPVTPPANGTVNSALTITASGSAATGTVTIQAQGTSGATTRSAGISLTVTAAPTPNFSVSCAPSSVTVPQGGSANSTCTVTSSGGFSSAVGLSCTGLPAGVSCAYAPASVTPPANGSASSTLTVSATAGAATGTFSFQAQGVSGALTRTANLSVTVSPVGGGGDLVASFDAARQAPSCNAVGRSCDSGASLLLGRGTLGPEPNQPNTINDSCADGTSGTFHSDESNDRIRVSTTDGSNFAPGKTVTIAATVWAWTTPSSDAADFYFAPDATNPVWTLIGTSVPTAAGAQTISRTYTLPSGGALQAVRVQFRYQSSSANCAAGAYNDRDDLVFAVGGAPPVTTVFFDNFETELGWTRNAGGTDTAPTGLWVRGNPEDTNDSGAKQLGTTVSGVNDLVTGALAGASAGVDDVDAGVTTIRGPAIVLPATGTLTLSFSYYLAHGSNATSADFFRAVVIGSTTSTVFESLGAAANRNGAWTTATANISGFAGQTVRIQFEAADAATASLVEAGVDDVRITQQ